MVADNLGAIPPNTALMIVTTDGKRYELLFHRMRKKNAKVIIEYKPVSKTRGNSTFESIRYISNIKIILHLIKTQLWVSFKKLLGAATRAQQENG